MPEIAYGTAAARCVASCGGVAASVELSSSFVTSCPVVAVLRPVVAVLGPPAAVWLSPTLVASTSDALADVPATRFPSSRVTIGLLSKLSAVVCCKGEEPVSEIEVLVVSAASDSSSLSPKRSASRESTSAAIVCQAQLTKGAKLPRIAAQCLADTSPPHSAVCVGMLLCECTRNSLDRPGRRCPRAQPAATSKAHKCEEPTRLLVRRRSSAQELF